MAAASSWRARSQGLPSWWSWPRRTAHGSSPAAGHARLRGSLGGKARV